MLDGASPNCIIFRPGALEAGPVVFGTMAGAMARIEELRVAANGSGCYVLGLDDSITSPLIIPAGVWDMTLVDIEARESVDALVLGQIAEGAVFTRARTFRGLMFLEKQGPTPVITDIVTSDTLVLQDGCILASAAGAGPMIDVTTLGASYAEIRCHGFGSLLAGFGAPVAHLGAIGNRLNIVAESTCGVVGDAITGVAGTELGLAGDGNALLDAANGPGFLGAVVTPAAINASGRMGNIVPPIGTAALAADVTSFFTETVIRTAGGFDKSLPLLPRAGGQDGGQCRRIVVRSDGEAQFAKPAGANTIEGLAAPYPIPDFGQVEFIGDGTSNWWVVSVAPSTGYELSWGGDAAAVDIGEFLIANAAADVATLPAIADARAGYPAPKAGTIRKLSWNSESADATTVLRIFKNGIDAGGHTLSGASGALTPAAPYVDVVPGDLLAIEYDAGTPPDMILAVLYIE